MIFDFLVYDTYVNVIFTLFYEQENLLLLAKTGFRKNLIFPLVLFIILILEVILILISLKLL